MQLHDIETVTRALHRLHVLTSTALGDVTSSADARCEQCSAQAQVAVASLHLRLSDS